MQVVFRRTRERGYSVAVRREKYPDVGMDPAPGYDPEMPHDLLHFVVEAELPIPDGIFGQLAAGGDAGTFGRDLEPAASTREARRRRRRAKRRGEKLARAGRDAAAWSERAAHICWYEWAIRSGSPAHRRSASRVADKMKQWRQRCSEEELDALSEEAIERVAHRLDELASHRWADLAVGETLELEWGSG